MPSFKPLNPVLALLVAVREIAKHNTDVALAYVANPALFAALTDKQRAQIHKSACFLYDVPKARRESTTVADLQSIAAQYTASGITPKGVWVQQRYNPLPMPGTARRLSLMALYDGLLKAGCVNPALDYTAAAQKGVAEKVLVEKMGGGTYMIASAEDEAEERAARATRKPAKAQADVASLLAQLGLAPVGK